MMNRYRRQQSERRASGPFVSFVSFCGITFVTLGLSHLLVADNLAAGLPGPEPPKRGGTLRLAFPSDWRSLDPAVIYDTVGLSVMRLMFQGLFEYDDAGNLVPDQIKDWSLSPDQRTYTFHLKPDIRFAHGREVEAEDYVFSLERILDPAYGLMGEQFFHGIRGATEFTEARTDESKRASNPVPRETRRWIQPTHVAGLRAPAKDTLIIELEKPDYVFRFVLAMGFARVVPRDLVEQYGTDFGAHLTGSGPYRLKEWRRGVGWHFERNRYYTGPDGFVDSVEVMIGGDATLHGMMFERGELDLLMSVSLADIPRFQQDRPQDWKFEVMRMAATDYFFMNTEMKPFDDVRVRRAVNHAINKNRLLRLANNLPVAARGVLPPTLPGWDPELPEFYPYDTNQARALLREAGYSEGFPIQLWCYGDWPIYARVAQGIQNDLHQVGIEAELQLLTFPAFLAAAQTRNRVRCGYAGWAADYLDPSNFFDPLLDGSRISPTDCNNLAFYDNPEVNRMLAEARRSLDANERLKLYRQAERLVLADAPWVPIMHPPQLTVIGSGLRGFRPHPIWLFRFEKLWLDR
jgi:ABC-type transport system substrate-binding protein